MGISLEFLRHLIDDISERGIRGCALTLGKQDVDCSLNELLACMSGNPHDGPQVTPRQKCIIEEFQHNGRMLSSKLPQATAGRISDEFFFRFLGFDKVASVDRDDYEHAT